MSNENIEITTRRGKGRPKLDGSGIPKKQDKYGVLLTCECGGSYSKRNLVHHTTTKKHKIFIETGKVYVAKTKNFNKRKEELDQETLEKKRQYMKIKMSEYYKKLRENSKKDKEEIPPIPL
jgi:hypothetical protein